MAKGQHPIPKRLKLAPGRPSGRPAGAVEPTPSADLPKPAEWLPKGAVPLFMDLRAILQDMGYASASHASALNLLALNLYQVGELSRELAEVGSDREDAPLRVQIRRALNVVTKTSQSLMVEFGLTPASCTRIAVPERGEGNRFSAFGAKVA